MKAYCLIALVSIWAASPAAAKAKQDGTLDSLKRELQALEALKVEKLDALEKAEALRWEQRYKQTASIRQYEERARILESAFNRVAANLGRAQDELVRLTNETRSINMDWEEFADNAQGFINMLSQAIDRESEKIGTDIPVGIASRTMAVNRLAQSAGIKSPEAVKIIKGFFRMKSDRLSLTVSQSLTSRNSLFDQKEHPVWRLQLGTVFIGELSKEKGEATQILLRTGKLQGKVFAWRSQLAENHNAKIAALIRQAVDGARDVEVTLDVLQNRSLGSGYTSGEKLSTLEAFTAWFKKGGLVMYPLLLAALLGLLLSLERMFFLSAKSTSSTRFMRNITRFLENREWVKGAEFCSRYKTSLSRVMRGIFTHATESRESAERAVRENLLKEIPSLEKRMILIAAIGGSAPLLGLLGTVSGMISLFKVITEVGTNDPRILAGGISEALVTTQTGLIIAIPILLMHGYLSDRMEKIENEVNSQSLTALNRIWPEGK